MKGLKTYKGKLTQEQLLELESLIMELQKLNGGPLPKGTVMSEFKALPEPKNTKLWEYILHMCKLYVMLPKTLDEVRAFAAQDEYNDITDYVEDITLKIAIYVMRYVWRHYIPGQVGKQTNMIDCGYVFTTAAFGWKSWKSERVSVTNTVPFDDDIDKERTSTGKIFTSERTNK